MHDFVDWLQLLILESSIPNLKQFQEEKENNKYVP